MDPVTIAILGTAAFGAAAWALRTYKPSWAQRLERIERYCGLAFMAIEMGAKLLGLKTPAAKLDAYLGKAESLVKSAGLPWSAKERAHAEKLATEWALAAKQSEGEKAIREALKKLGAAGEEAERFAKTRLGASGELGSGKPPSAR